MPNPEGARARESLGYPPKAKRTRAQTCACTGSCYCLGVTVLGKQLELKIWRSRPSVPWDKGCGSLGSLRKYLLYCNFLKLQELSFRAMGETCHRVVLAGKYPPENEPYLNPENPPPGHAAFEYGINIQKKGGAWEFKRDKLPGWLLRGLLFCQGRGQNRFN